jgi:hypothetical protein
LLLEHSQGKQRTIAEVVEAAMVSQGTVSNTKKCYFTGGLQAALYDKPHAVALGRQGDQLQGATVKSGPLTLPAP